MSVLPDPGELRALATLIDHHARAARARADRLGVAVAATDWEGLAARAFGGQARGALGGLRTAAGRLTDAADALRRHADRVDTVLATLEGIVRAGLATMDELRALPAATLRGLACGAQDLVAAGISVGGGALSTVEDVAGSALDLVGL